MPPAPSTLAAGQAEPAAQAPRTSAHLVVIQRDGRESAIDATPDRSVMELLRDNGIDELVAMCGGCCSCATCHVYVDPAFADLLPPIGEDERGLLDCAGSLKPTSRLSCQIQFTDALNGLRVTVAPED